MSTEPIRAHDALREVQRLRSETDVVLRELKDRGPTVALRLLARDLRERLKAEARTIERLLAVEEGAVIAFRQRTGRDPEDGDLILPADDARGEKFVAALQSKAGTC